MMHLRKPAGGVAATAFLLALLFPALLHAQTRGTVVDAEGRPVASAVVELWAGSRLASGTESDALGRFELGAPADGSRMLSVRRLGFRTRTVELGAADTAVVVRLEQLPLVLDGVSVAVAARRLCPNRDDPRARALWQRMRSRYWQRAADTVFVHAFMERRSGTGAQADAFRPEAGRVVTGWTTGALVIPHPALMARSGYAGDARGGVGERTGSWLYRALDQGMVQDFTDDFFGGAHSFSIISEGASWVVAFCPRARLRSVGQIEGTLHVAPDSTLTRARWAFLTPRPSEDAGGEASYYAPDPALGLALLAHETFFWRRSGSGRFYFEGHTFTGWRRWSR